jgi:hypothetical protein
MPVDIYPVATFTGNNDTTFWYAQIGDFDFGNTISFGTNTGSPMASINTGSSASYINEVEIYTYDPGQGQGEAIQYVKFVTNTGQTSEGGTKTGTKNALKNIRVIRMGFAQGNPYGSSQPTSITGIYLEYVENYTPGSVIQRLTHAIVGYQVGPGNYDIYTQNYALGRQAIALLSQGFANLGLSGSALGDFYCRACGFCYENMPYGPNSLGEIAQSLLTSIASEGQSFPIKANHVMVQTININVHLNGTHIWFEPNDTVMTDVINISDTGNATRFQGNYDLTGTLYTVLTSLQPLETTVHGVTYYSDSSLK